MHNVLRTLAERISRQWAWKRRLPVEFGRAPLFVSPDAQLKYLKPGRSGFDESLLRIAMEEVRRGDVVWDVGASIGVFALSAAVLTGKSGKVLAIEPDNWIAALLEKSSMLPDNRELSITILVAAVSNVVGTDTLLIAKRGRASSALVSAGGRDQMGGARQRIQVQTVTLDSLLTRFAAPDLLKIDVEGAEKKVLEGASRLLSQVRPRIYIEVGAETCEDVTNIFRESNYVLLDPRTPGPNRARLKRCAFNTLAVPREAIEGESVPHVPEDTLLT